MQTSRSGTPSTDRRPPSEEDWARYPTELPLCPKGHQRSFYWDAVAGQWALSAICQACVTEESVARIEAEIQEVKENIRKAQQDELAHRFPSQYDLTQGLYQSMTLASYQAQTPRQAAAQTRACELARQWAKGEKGGILFYSSLKHVGVGKTHLAVALLREARVLGWTSSIWSVPHYLRLLKDSYDKGGSGELAQALEGVDVLCLDDLGAEHTQTPPWLQEWYFNVLDGRAVAKRVLIATTNRDDTELAKLLGPRAFSRLHLLVGEPVTLDGPDYRLRQRQPF